MAGPEQMIQPPHVGRVLGGRYRLVAPVARGGMAEVWEGYDEVLSRPVAVKVLQAHLATDSAFLERFRREAVTAARLAHPCIVATFDTGFDAGTAFIVMELVRGRNLRQVLDDYGRLEPWQAVAVGRQVADALAYAHGAGLVHRDIKPANVLLVEDEWGGLRVKVTDFGIAKAGYESGADLTRTGMVLGTPKYLSPEQIRGRDSDARADLYSLGVVLYEMLVGTTPFVGETDMATALLHLSERVPKPSASVRGIPGSLDRVVCDLLAKTPDRRVATATDLRRRLDEIGLVAGPPGSNRRARRSARDRTGTGSIPAVPSPGTPPLPGYGYGAPPPPPPGDRYAGPVGNGSQAAPGSGYPPADGSGAGWGEPAVPRTGPAAPVGSAYAGDQTRVGDPSAAGGTTVFPASPTTVLGTGRSGPSGPAYGAPGTPQPVGGFGPAGDGSYAAQDRRPAGQPRRFRRSERVAGIVVAALVLIGVVVGAIVLSSSGSHRTANHTPGGATTSSAGTVPIAGVTVYMVNSRPPDNPGQTKFTFDGNPATVWSTDHYNSATFGNLYPGMGLLIQVAPGHTLHQLTVTSPTQGWAASVYTSATPIPSGQPASAWGAATDAHQGIGGGATFSLGDHHATYVLLYITNLGPSDMAQIAELSIK